MSAEQTPDIAAVLAEHEGWPSERYDARGTYYVMCCDCGWEEPKQPDAYEGSSNDRHRTHVAAALVPVLAAAVRESEQRALREAADEHEAELVCCDIFERLRDKSPADLTDAERAQYRSHSICYWGAACAEGDRDRADRITEPVSHEAATSGEEE